MDIKLIRAFIASPGGLENERRAAFAAAEEVNRSVARPLGARLELIGWEETLSGIGRPQALINADMETCDLFIGAIWTTWGSRPSTDGPYSSGFEEEFELSRGRHTRTKSPIMAMFFKQIDVQQMRDPGDELKKVLSFQERLRTEKVFLYDSFVDAEQFALKVRTFLSTHVIEMLKEGRNFYDDRLARTLPDTGGAEIAPSSDPESTNSPSNVDREEALFLQGMAKSFCQEDGLSVIDVARLRLIAATAGATSNDHQLIGVHDANLLYLHRDDFAFSLSEKRGLLEAGLAQIVHQNVPVWSWLSELNGDRPGLLLALSMVGEEAERSGALKAMRLLGQKLAAITTFDPQIAMKSLFEENTPTQVRVAALHYLRDLGTAADLPSVEAEAKLATKETGAAAIEAVLAILLRVDESAAARYLLDSSFETLPNEILPLVLPNLAELGSEELLKGLDHRAADVRARSIGLLSTRAALSIETLSRAREDESATVRLAAVRALDRLGQPLSLDEVEEVLSRSRKPSSFFALRAERDAFGEALFEIYRAERLASMAVAPLKVLLGSGQHRDAAYRALARRSVEDFSARLKSDIADGFNTYFSRHWPEGIKAPPRSGFGLLSLGNTDPAQTKRRDLVEAGLDIVASRGDRGDLSFIRQILDGQQVAPSTAVIAYLAAAGDAVDIPRLGRAPQLSWSTILAGQSESAFDSAVKTILKLGKGRLAEVLATSIRGAMKAQILELASWADFTALSDATIIELLLSEDEALRRAAARKAAAALPRRRVKNVFVGYKADPKGIYYIVTHWLDLGLALPQRFARRVIGQRP